MSFSVTINGHVGTKEAERDIVESLRQWVKEQEAGVEYAVVVTSYRGRVDLKGAEEVTAEELRIKQLETELEGLKQNRSETQKSEAERLEAEEVKTEKPMNIQGAETHKTAEEEASSPPPVKKTVPSLKDAQTHKDSQPHKR